MKWWDQMPWSSFSECWVLSQLFPSPFIKISLSSRAFLVPLHFLPYWSCHLQCCVNFCCTAKWLRLGFSDSSAGKESTSNAGDPGSIPGLGSFPRAGIGYPLQYSWASLVAQMVKNLPSVWETWVQSLGRGNPLEEGMATHSGILTWKIPMDRGAW